MGRGQQGADAILFGDGGFRRGHPIIGVAPKLTIPTPLQRARLDSAEACAQAFDALHLLRIVRRDDRVLVATEDELAESINLKAEISHLRQNGRNPDNRMDPESLQPPREGMAAQSGTAEPLALGRSAQRDRTRSERGQFGVHRGEHGAALLRADG
jgi:hypothetical protein